MAGSKKFWDRIAERYSKRPVADEAADALAEALHLDGPPTRIECFDISNFQGRETVNRYYDATPGIVQKAMDRFGEITGRRYGLFDYHGDPNAERVIVLMGSGADTVTQTIDALHPEGVGVLNVRLYRPFSAEHMLAALPESVKTIAVLDRTKESGASGERS